jgi:hypothetical protein
MKCTCMAEVNSHVSLDYFLVHIRNAIIVDTVFIRLRKGASGISTEKGCARDNPPSHSSPPPLRTLARLDLISHISSTWEATMPYLPILADWVQQSKLLLEARPATVCPLQCHAIPSCTQHQNANPEAPIVDSHHNKIQDSRCCHSGKQGGEAEEDPKTGRRRVHRRSGVCSAAAERTTSPASSEDVLSRVWRVLEVQDGPSRRSRPAHP